MAGWRLMLLCAVLCLDVHAQTAAPDWQSLAPGLDYTWVELARGSGSVEHGIDVYRAEPARWSLHVLSLGNDEAAPGLSARQWAEREGLSLAINAGMYAQDYRSHVGFLQVRGARRTSHINRYESVVAFDPLRSGLPPFRIVDLDSSGRTVESLASDYGSLIQNLRLIRRPAENRWRDRGEAWSEAALGEDAEGRMLFLFSRQAVTMHQFNEALLTSGIGIVAAQHLEGGPEAQLYLNIGGQERELLGIYRAPFSDGDAPQQAWPVPHVLGLRARDAD